MPDAPGTGPGRARANKAYWDAVWGARQPGRRAIFESRWERDFQIRRFDRFLVRSGLLRGRDRGSFLEVGCGGSLWLPYFARRWGYRVEGIDYSERGCRLAEEVLSRYGVDGTVHPGDFFDPPKEMEGRYDVVLSNGVVEHFEDRARCLEAFRYFLRPSGLLLTIIPNLCGSMGTITRILMPGIYGRHVPTSREDLAEAHAVSGLRLIHCDYFTPIHLGVLNFETVRPALLRAALSGGSTILSMAVCGFLDGFRRPMASRRFSPYVLAVAEAGGRAGQERPDTHLP